MTAAVAPAFTERYPEIAIIFDNLHMMHDVVSDILTSPEVPRERKRAEILRAAALFRDDTSHVTTVEAWRAMAEDMGLQNQGGPPVGFLPALPTPTVPRGMSMAGMDHAGHAADPHAGHTPAAPDPHAAHTAAQGADSAAVVHTVHAFHDALASGDSAAVLALLAEDVVVLESGGVDTKEEYRAGHLAGDVAFARAVRRQGGAVRVAISGDVAWASSTNTVRGMYRDREVNSQSAELMVLRRTPAGWRIAAIHWSSRALRNP